MMVCLTAALSVMAQTQRGIVRTLERPKQPSQGINGAIVNILEYKNNLLTDKNGKFSFSIPGKKPGEPFKVSRVQKKDYTLVDKQLLGRKFSYSSTVPIEIVMVSDKQLAADKKRIEDKAYARAQKKYEARIAKLKRQLAEKTITEQAYYAERELAINDYDKYIQLIEELAERYATTDYKGLSDINRQIQECIENAELERADSLINSKGDFDQREQELRSQMEMNQATAEFLAQSQQDAEFKLNDLAQDCYNKHTIFVANYRNDSAACWLERRAALDTTNLDWQNDAGRFINDYLANYSLAMEYFQRGLHEAVVQDGEQSNWVATFYNNIGSVIKEQDNYAQALECYIKALDIYKKEWGEDHPITATAYSNIGGVYFTWQKYDQALVYYSLTLSINEKKLGEKHPITATAYNNIGAVYDNMDEDAQALVFYNKALEIFKTFFGENHPNTATSYSHIGGVYVDMEEYDQALEYYSKALDIRKKVLSEDHPDIALSFNDIGMVFNKLEAYDESLEYYNKALEIDEKKFGKKHLNTAIDYNNIAAVYYEQEKYDQAYEYLEKAYPIFKEKLGEDHPVTEKVLMGIVDVMMMLVEE